MKTIIIAITLVASATFSETISTAPAGKKIHKEIKSGKVITPAPATAKPMSSDKSTSSK